MNGKDWIDENVRHHIEDMLGGKTKITDMDMPKPWMVDDEVAFPEAGEAAFVLDDGRKGKVSWLVGFRILGGSKTDRFIAAFVEEMNFVVSDGTKKHYQSLNIWSSVGLTRDDHDWLDRVVKASMVDCHLKSDALQNIYDLIDSKFKGKKAKQIREYLVLFLLSKASGPLLQEAMMETIQMIQKSGSAAVKVIGQGQCENDCANCQAASFCPKSTAKTGGTAPSTGSENKKKADIPGYG